MRYRTLLVPALCLLPALAARAAPADPAPAEATLELYKTRCQSCHMPDGNAPLEIMNLSDDKWTHGSDKADVIRTITEGVPTTAMLPFKTLLTPAEIADLAAYVRSFDKTLAAAKPKPKPRKK
jgi:cytochrome c oxidase cbb3-type subunit 3